jgi:hypothetical protein
VSVLSLTVWGIRAMPIADEAKLLASDDQRCGAEGGEVLLLTGVTGYGSSSL